MNTSIVTAVDDLSSINEVPSNATAFDETSPIRVYQLRHKRLPSQSHDLFLQKKSDDFGANLGNAVPKGDRSAIYCQQRGCFLG